MRVAGRLYVAHFALAIGGGVAKSVPLQIAGTVAYFAVAVALHLIFAPADRLVALTLLPLALAGCGIQAIGQARADTKLRRLALAPFGLFLIVLGASSCAPAPRRWRSAPSWPWPASSGHWWRSPRHRAGTPGSRLRSASSLRDRWQSGCSSRPDLALNAAAHPRTHTR